MKPQITTLFASGVLALALFGAAVAGPFEDGRAAYQRGDYAGVNKRAASWTRF
jgi:hypothetical protein